MATGRAVYRDNQGVLRGVHTGSVELLDLGEFSRLFGQNETNWHTCGFTVSTDECGETGRFAVASNVLEPTARCSMKRIVLFPLWLVVLAVGLSAADKWDESRRLINDGKASEALERLKPALESDPGDAEVHELLALAYLQQNKLDEARGAAEKAIEAGPDRAASHVAAARVAIARQDWKGAESELNKAKGLEESNSDVTLYRGSLLLARKDYKGSTEALTPFVAAHPENAYGHYYMGLAQYGLKRRDKTVEHFQRFLTLAPNAPEAARVESLLRSFR